MAKPKIVDAAEVKRQPRPAKKAPATRMIEQLPEGHLTSRTVAERFDVNIETIRRLARAKDAEGKDKFTAPSKAMKSGELIIWVYTPADIEELTEYFEGRLPRPVKERNKQE